MKKKEIKKYIKTHSVFYPSFETLNEERIETNFYLIGAIFLEGKLFKSRVDLFVRNNETAENNDKAIELLKCFNFNGKSIDVLNFNDCRKYKKQALKIIKRFYKISNGL